MELSYTLMWPCSVSFGEWKEQAACNDLLLGIGRTSQETIQRVSGDK